LEHFVLRIIVKHEALHLPAVDEYLAVLVQLCTRQLLDESVKHGALGGLESVGIIYKRVPFVVKLHLRGFYSHSVQFVHFRSFVHRYVANETVFHILQWFLFQLLAQWP